ncbi:hypothetical protein MHM95_12525 [Pseudoalteromonas sp. CnMc7-15]|uniref:hypothetical protein n=1 Tax=unclassified Pseudoalteromonas TaxID=194690 RepID=UPI001EF57D0B|nr:hypothetical protein [Pseudoalteromonas sp. CnMc7-15]MCG7567106.1 hypothetical protein [Pseudoalteromonas sp. CnMc7-15]
MQINSNSDLFMAIEPLSETQQDEVILFLETAQAAPDMDALITSFDDVERTDHGVAFKVKGNYQHVTACVSLSFDKDSAIVVEIQCYI